MAVLRIKDGEGAWRGIPAIKGDPGDTGPGVPTGGAIGQAVVKSGPLDFAAEWASVGRSNPNLVLNWDFRNPINQLTLATFPATVGATGLDMWLTSSGSCAINAGHIALNGGIVQRFEQALETREYTASVMINNVVYSRQLTYAGADVSGSIDATGVSVILRSNSNTRTGIQLITTNAVNIQAVKLEVGNNSTLAFDSPVNSALMLMQCQRYFYRIIGYWKFVGTGRAISTSQVECPITVPVPMRIVPTISTTNLALLRIAHITSSVTPTAVAVAASIGNIVDVLFDAAMPTAREVVTLFFDNGGNLSFDARL